MATIVEGLTAAQCWTCDRFYGLFFGETVSLEMGNRIPKLRPPLGNPDTEERAWWLASDRLGVVYEETLAYAEAAESGMAFKPSKPVIERVLEQGAGMVDAPIRVMVPNKASRLSAADLTCCLSSTAPAAGSFVRGPGEGLLIAGPELAVLQLALKLPMPKLAELICELCSTYYYDLAEVPQLSRSEDGLLSRVEVQECARSNRPVPVSCLRAMEWFSAQSASSKAGRAMARAVRYAVDGSASPMETALALMLCLPKTAGGYGLPKPQMNRVLPLDAETGRVRVADLFWPEAKIAVEYDSDAFHAEKEKLRRDALRRNQLESQSVTVLTATAEHLSSLAALDELAGQIARALGRSLHRGRLAAAGERAALLASLKQRSIEGLR